MGFAKNVIIEKGKTHKRYSNTPHRLISIACLVFSVLICDGRRFLYALYRVWEYKTVVRMMGEMKNKLTCW